MVHKFSRNVIHQYENNWCIVIQRVRSLLVCLLRTGFVNSFFDTRFIEQLRVRIVGELMDGISKNSYRADEYYGDVALKRRGLRNDVDCSLSDNGGHFGRRQAGDDGRHVVEPAVAAAGGDPKRRRGARQGAAGGRRRLRRPLQLRRRPAAGRLPLRRTRQPRPRYVATTMR